MKYRNNKADKVMNKTRNLLYSITTCLIIVGCSAGNSTPSSGSQYTLVVDSGSSGNRIYLYKVVESGSFPIITDLFESSNSVPLASFIANPESAGVVAIQPLLISSMTKLNELNVPVNIVTTSDMGTAGMRLIAESTQQAIYTSVTQTISNNQLPVGRVATITGQEEGVYSWIDANYMSGALQSGMIHGIIEMGGASTQIVFQTTDTENTNVVHMCVNNVNYNIYSISFLGLGQDSARTTMNSNPNYDACYPDGYTNGDISGSYNFASCLNNYSTVQLQPKYSSLLEISVIPGFSSTSFVGLSSLFYVFDFYGLAQNPTQAGLESGINELCYMNYNQMQESYPAAYKLYNQCANSTYVDSFLYTFLKVGNTQLTTTATIDGTAMTWTLGYVLTQSVPNSIGVCQ